MFLESRLAKYFAATLPAAPVLMSVIVVPPIIAMGAPVAGSISTIMAMTVGRLALVRLSGCTLTILTAEVSRFSRKLGMALRSPLYFL